MMAFRRVDRPTLFPSQCRCGSQNGPLADTMIEDGVGRLYVCASCAREINRALGGVVLAADHEALQERLRVALEHTDTLTTTGEQWSLRAHQAEEKLRAAEAELAWRRDERGALESSLVAMSREVVEARDAGFVSDADRRAAADAELQSDAEPEAKGRRRRRTPVNEGAK